MLLDEEAAGLLAESLRDGRSGSRALEVKPFTEKPKPRSRPARCNRRRTASLGFTARRTMNAAQSLYENGYITYMRTDSTTLAEVAVKTARELVQSEYGDGLLVSIRLEFTHRKSRTPRKLTRRFGRPDTDFPTPQSLKQRLNADEFKLYDMIWKRTVASQMADARKRRITITVEGCRSGVSGQRHHD